jgi:hypothetical protein
VSVSLEVDYDPDVWIEVDRDADLDEWAVRVARQCYEDSALEPSDRQLTVLATQLREFAARLGEGDGPGGPGGLGIALLHLRYPEDGPLTAALISAADAGDGSEASLRAIAGADDPGLIEPPDVQWIETPLGVAMRVWRYAAHPDLGRSGVYAALTYIWHLPQYDADVRLTTSSFELGELTLAAEDIDHLAQGITITP